ncbi:hypothetical protein LY78DRAFT_658435 [Colletotrichum sublineola]|nr:hypothetical protein LY78DRAFT_658435 [Colletotrichum sublineola]
MSTASQHRFSQNKTEPILEEEEEEEEELLAASPPLRTTLRSQFSNNTALDNLIQPFLIVFVHFTMLLVVEPTKVGRRCDAGRKGGLVLGLRSPDSAISRWGRELERTETFLGTVR